MLGHHGHRSARGACHIQLQKSKHGRPPTQVFFHVLCRMRAGRTAVRAGRAGISARLCWRAPASLEWPVLISRQGHGHRCTAWKRRGNGRRRAAAFGIRCAAALPQESRYTRTSAPRGGRWDSHHTSRTTSRSTAPRLSASLIRNRAVVGRQQGHVHGRTVGRAIQSRIGCDNG